MELYSNQDLKKQLSEMMQDLKESFSLVTTSDEVDNTHPQKYSMEGGEKVLQDKIELAAKYGIDVESLDFSLEDYTVEELTQKFEAMKPVEEPADEVPAEEIHAEPEQTNFALTSDMVDEIVRTLESVKTEREWGECARYWYVDCDFEAGEVYCWDTNDWLLYGFSYAKDGDNIVIDFESKKRKKYVIADFDEGESQDSPFAAMFSQMEQKLHSGVELEEKYQAASGTITTMEKELEQLRQFKADTENAAASRARDEVFAQFEDLVGVEAFENLRENCDGMSIDAIEDKCYAIRGRNIVVKFSDENKAPKIKVTKEEVAHDEPYGGVFVKYGVGA